VVLRKPSKEAASSPDDAARWLLLIHQIPPKPDYFRVKVGKRLAKLGAVAVKRSVYVLPFGESTLEDFQWLAREIVADGGDATVCRASFVEGLRDEQVEALFHEARGADYATVADEAREAASELPRRLRPDDERRAGAEARLAKLKKRFDETLALDFFGAPGREPAEAALSSLEKRLARGPDPEGEGRGEPVARDACDYQARTWVTRKNVHVDRIGSAWLIRRFIDPRASFKFVPAQGYVAAEGELTFDMAEAAFTHVGDRCTFETLVVEFALREPGLGALAEVVHDVDVKDGKFSRAEAPGVAALVAGIALTERDDEARIELGGRMFDALLELYRRKRA
jgi:hypothetical protein